MIVIVVEGNRKTKQEINFFLSRNWNSPHRSRNSPQDKVRLHLPLFGFRQTVRHSYDDRIGQVWSFVVIQLVQENITRVPANIADRNMDKRCIFVFRAILFCIVGQIMIYNFIKCSFLVCILWVHINNIANLPFYLPLERV